MQTILLFVTATIYFPVLSTETLSITISYTSKFSFRFLSHFESVTTGHGNIADGSTTTGSILLCLKSNFDMSYNQSAPSSSPQQSNPAAEINLKKFLIRKDFLHNEFHTCLVLFSKIQKRFLNMNIN